MDPRTVILSSSWVSVRLEGTNVVLSIDSNPIEGEDSKVENHDDNRQNDVPSKAMVIRGKGQTYPTIHNCHDDAELTKIAMKDSIER